MTHDSLGEESLRQIAHNVSAPFFWPPFPVRLFEGISLFDQGTMIHKFKSPYQIFNPCFRSNKLGGLVKRGTLDQSRFFPNCLPSIFASLRAKVSSVFQTQVEPQKMASGDFAMNIFFNATGFNEK